MKLTENKQCLILALKGALLSIIIAVIITALLSQYLSIYLSIFFAATLATVLTEYTLFRAFIQPIQDRLKRLRDYDSQRHTLEEKEKTGSPGHEDYHQVLHKLIHFSDISQQLSDKGNSIAISAAEVSFGAERLGEKLGLEVGQLNDIANSSAQIAETVDEVAQSTSKTLSLAVDTKTAIQDGQRAIEKTAQQLELTKEQAASSSSQILELADHSKEILRISEVIGNIAEQTNMLALNAAIEAARAGEHGRGFSVVADEVRDLANKTADATKAIGVSTEDIVNEINDVVHLIHQLMNEVTAGVEQADIVRNKLEGMVTLANEVETQVNTVNRNSESNALEVEQISQFISLLTQHMNSSGQQVSHIADQAQAVSENAEHIHDVLGGVKLETIHHRMYEVAKEAVEDIQTVFEQAVQAGTVSIEDLFDREYVQIENTNPPKFHTRFDRFTDDVLPNIQEPILAQNAEVAYAGAVDNNGYFPTHNKCYAQDLTGNYQTDLANNRTKRIFSDRTGSRCGSHTKDFLLQTYKRDTGEVMHDLSVPIYINERHWGGFRIGYRSVIPNEENKLVESEDNDNQTDQVEFF